MKFLRRMFALFTGRSVANAKRELRHEKTLRKADHVIEDFRKLDGALRIVVAKK